MRLLRKGIVMPKKKLLHGSVKEFRCIGILLKECRMPAESCDQSGSGPTTASPRLSASRCSPGSKPAVWSRRSRDKTRDLHHTFASRLASSGVSLQIIGKLIGHTQASTTMRYAHLQDENLRAATEQFGRLIKFPKRKRA